jgi:hypothetical protein
MPQTWMEWARQRRVLGSVDGRGSAVGAGQPHTRCDSALHSGNRSLGLFRRRHSPGVAHQVRTDRQGRHRGGVNTGVDPVTFFGRAGIAPDQLLKDAVDIYQKVARPKGASAHILTGPIYIEEAAPGDMLEIRILALEPRVPYGVNSSNRGTGGLPDLLTGPTPKVIKFDVARNVALFSNDIEVPLQPFMGIMAVAPTRESWMISSRPP